MLWFFEARVTVVETSESARLEVDIAAHAIDAPVSGRITLSSLAIGLEVAAGDVLLEIDSEPEKRRLEEETARLATMGTQVQALQRALVAEEQVILSDRGATAIALDQARARQQEAEIAKELGSEEAARAAQLYDSGAIAELEALRKKSEANRQRAAAQAVSLDVDRQYGDHKTRESQTRAHIEDMRRDLATLEGQAATSAATINFLRYEIDRRSVRALVAGRVGDAADLRPGAYVKEGEKLGAIVPRGDIRVVAEFAPSAALGRIRRGQPARVRLEGYPWLEYGMLRAVVTNVASELRAGKIRVELAVRRDIASALPLEHGLPGAAEVEVERVTPATLVSRAVGRTLMRRADAPVGSLSSSSDRAEAKP
jgi:membrane fusion protein (multidrug efflux system)